MTRHKRSALPEPGVRFTTSSIQAADERAVEPKAALTVSHLSTLHNTHAPRARAVAPSCDAPRPVADATGSVVRSPLKRAAAPPSAGVVAQSRTLHSPDGRRCNTHVSRVLPAHEAAMQRRLDAELGEDGALHLAYLRRANAPLVADSLRRAAALAPRGRTR